MERNVYLNLLTARQERNYPFRNGTHSSLTCLTGFSLNLTAQLCPHFTIPLLHSFIITPINTECLPKYQLTSHVKKVSLEKKIFLHRTEPRHHCDHVASPGTLLAHNIMAVEADLEAFHSTKKLITSRPLFFSRVHQKGMQEQVKVQRRS